MKKAIKKVISIIIIAAVFILVVPIITAGATEASIVVSEVQTDSTVGAGGTADDWVELYNPTDSAVILDGWSIQEGLSDGSSFYRKELIGTIPAQGYFLIVRSDADSSLTDLADVIAATSFSLTDDNVIYLVNNNEDITGADDPDIVDLVGFGDSTIFEGTGTAANPAESGSIERKSGEIHSEGKGNGWDSNDNSADFFVSTPNPQNTASTSEAPPLDVCKTGCVYSTIQSAIDAATEGDTINVAAGTYTEDLTIDIGITMSGSDASEVTVNGEHTISSDDVTLEEVTFNIAADTAGILIDSSSSTINNIIITDSVFDFPSNPGTGVVGIILGGYSSPNKVSNIYINNNVFNGPDNKNCNPWKIGGGFGSPVSCEVQDVDFENNAVDRCSTPINLQDSNIDDLLINNNVYTNTDGVLYVWAQDGSAPSGALSNFVFTNNDVDSTNSYGVAFFDNDLNGDTFTDTNFGTGNRINNNEFVGITETYGLKSLSMLADLTTYELDAENNWWGCNEGPGEAGCDAVSGTVDYTPWTVQAEDTISTTNGIAETVDTAGTAAGLTITTIGDQSGTVTIQQSSEEYHGGFGATALGKFINIESTIANEDISEVEIRISYTDDELTAIGLDETSLKLYWWNSASEAWELLGSTGVNTTGNYVWAITNHFSDFGVGGDPDTDAPVITDVYTSPKYASLADKLVTIFATIADGGSGVKHSFLYYQIGDEDLQNITFSGPLTGGSAGIFHGNPQDGIVVNYHINSTDNVDNSARYPGSGWLSYTYDGTDPVTTLTIDDPKYGSTFISSSTSIELSCTDATSGCNKTYYRINEGSVTEYTTPFTVANEDGDHTIHYYSVDNATNEENSTPEVITLDNSAPITTDNAASDWQGADLVVGLTPTDGSGSGVNITKYCVDTTGACTPATQGISASVTCAADSVCESQYVNYQSQDNLGQWETAHMSSIIKIDKEKPDTTDDASSDWQNTNATVSLTCEDHEASGCQVTYYTTDGSDPTTGSAQGTEILVTADGTSTVKYFSVDNVGNSEAVQTAANTVKIDRTVPTITEDYANDGVWVNEAQDVTLDPTDTGGSGIGDVEYCEGEGCAPNIVLAAPYLLSYLADKNTIVRYKVTDRATNPSEIDEFNLKLDMTIPTITDNYEHDGTWVSENQTVTLSPADALSGINVVKYCTGAACTPDITTTDYAIEFNGDQDTILRYQTWDNASNPSEIGEVNIKIDTTGPTIIDDYANDAVWVNTDQTITLTPSDSGGSGIKEVKYCSGAECTPTNVLAAPYQLAYTTNQDTIVRYIVVDNANRESGIGEFNVKIDKTIPTVTEDYGNDGVWVTTDQTVNLTPADEGGSDIDVVEICYSAGCTPSDELEEYAISFTEDINMMVRYQAWDNADNPSLIGEFKIMLDKHAPTFITNEGTDGEAVTSDIINVNVDDTYLDESSLNYGFSADINCEEEVAWEEGFTNNVDFTITGDHTDYLCVKAADLAGNIGYHLVGQLNVDNSNPTLTSVSIMSSNTNNAYAQVEDTVTIAFTASEDLKATPDVTIDGNTATITQQETASTWIATRTMQTGDTAGVVTFAIDFSDLAGNDGTQVTDVTDESSVTFDETNPVGDLADIPVEWQNTDATLTLSCTDSEGSGCNSNEFYLTVVPIGDFGVDMAISNGGCTPIDQYTEPVFVSEHSTVCWRVTDNAGNVHSGSAEITVDEIDPDLEDDYGENNGMWVNSDQTITLFHSDSGNSDIDDVLICYGSECDPDIDGTELNEPYTIDFNNDTDTVLRYQAWDNAGNPSGVGEIDIMIDKTIPTTNDDYAYDAVWINTDQTITLIPYDELSGVDEVLYCIGSECEPDLLINEPYDVPFSGDTVATLRYLTIDAAGNSGETEEVIVKIDETIPTIADDYLFDDIWVNTNQLVTHTPTDGLSDIKEVRYCNSGPDCEPDTLLTGLYQITYVTDQETTVRYRAWDNADNPSVVGEYIVKIDTVSPDVTNSGPSGELDYSTPTLTVTTDKETICKYDTNLKSFDNMANYLGSSETLGLAHTANLNLYDGSYTYYIRCRDKANNEISTTVTFTIDTAANYGFTENLVPTWDTFTLPKFVLEDLGYTTPELRSPESILASIASNYEIIWYYDGVNWVSYKPDTPEWTNDLIEFNDMQSNPYWITMINEDRLEIADLNEI